MIDKERERKKKEERILTPAINRLFVIFIIAKVFNMTLSTITSGGLSCWDPFLYYFYNVPT